MRMLLLSYFSPSALDQPASALPPELIEEYDEIVRIEIRSRARMMEVALRE